MSRRNQSKAERKADQRITMAYYRTGDGVQIPMSAISGIYRDVRAMMTEQTTDEQLDALMTAVLDAVRVN